MNTVILTIRDPERQQAEVAQAAQLLRQGKLVAFPTETVYGLGGNGLDPAAVKAIYAAKGRPQDNPLILHVAEAAQARDFARDIPPIYEELCRRFSPGPLTVILKKRDCVPLETSGGLDTVAIRIPSHPVAQAILRACGLPIAAPSANLSGKPSPTTFRHVAEDLLGRVDAIVDGGDCAVGVESTVISLTGEHPLLLRPGAVTVEELRPLLPDLEIHPAVTGRLAQGASAPSPGMRYKHYAPKAKVTIVDGSPAAYGAYVAQHQEPGVFALCFEEDLPYIPGPHIVWGSSRDGASQGHRLFSALRELDEAGASQVYAHGPSQEGMGLAVYNRLIRAAGFDEVKLQGPGPETID